VRAEKKKGQVVTWTRQVLTAEVAPGQLLALAGCWDLRRGDHPSLAKHLATDLNDGARLPRFPDAAQWADLAPLQLPLRLVTHGHHVLQDAGPHQTLSGNADAPDEIPLAPVFVRDLAGRVIHTGLNPLPSVPDAPLFPAGCADVAASTPGAELIENTLFVTLRRLELGVGAGAVLAGQPHVALQVVYGRPDDYPYKLRPDTLYQDGWRLPQVARLFARAAQPTAALTAGEQVLAAWQQWCAQHGPEADYEQFYEAQGGAAWFEELFLVGCTVIPTVEAYNGHYTVADDYTVTDVSPGRAVPGLHVVVGEVSSPLPRGSIVAVKMPGFVTAQHVQPAQVVISEGGSSAGNAPAPLLPDLRLPHPRLAPTSWEAVWLPTHPSHFAAPALWDWQPSGHFAQVSGPLWDPLHYVYASTATLVRATTRPHPSHPHVYVLPEKFRTRFHPMVTLTWVDEVNQVTAAARSELHPWYGSQLDSMPLTRSVAPVGYHALPSVYEPEMGPDYWPEQQPQHHLVQLGPCPAKLMARLAPLAQREAPRVGQDAAPVVTTQSMRQLLMLASTMAPSSVAALLPELPASQLQLNVKRLFANRHYRRALAGVSATLGAGLFHLREAGLAWRRKRYRLFTRYPAAWVAAQQQGVDLTTAENLLGTLEDAAHTQARLVQAAQHPSLGLARNTSATPLDAAAPTNVAHGLPALRHTGSMSGVKNQKRSSLRKVAR
jgi:hypothetical protein